MAAKKAPKKRAPRKPKKPAEAELKPFKIVGQLVGARYNEHGDVVGEDVMGDVAIYAVNFSRVKQIVDQAVKDARKAKAQGE
jgi:hypothetical protein